jgi:glycosyltransferase involved in cell wall biosynthesis
MKTRLTFVLPGRGTKPVGGFRVVYEYANRLSARGMDVTIVHTAWLYRHNPFLEGIGRFIYCYLFYRFHKKWFYLAREVKNNWVLMPLPWLLPDADFIVATCWETSEYIAGLPKNKGKGFYLIQGDESAFSSVIRGGLVKRVLDTWKLPLRKIVISTWLKERLQSTGNNSTVIFNGLNSAELYIKQPPEKRSNCVVIMLYHLSPNKGCSEGLEAFRILKEQMGELEIILFGVPSKPEGLEDWIRYYKLPSRDELRALYNEAAIFLTPSHSEGWGLPAAEAMQCGCAVIVTDIGGFKDFAKDGITALCCKVGDVNDMVRKLHYLLVNRDERIKLAHKGNSYIQNFDWDRAVNDFEQELKMAE